MKLIACFFNSKLFKATVAVICFVLIFLTLQSEETNLKDRNKSSVSADSDTIVVREVLRL